MSRWLGVPASTRRLAVSVFLAVVCIASIVEARRADRDALPVAPPLGAQPITPVLSARRVPGLLVAPVADARLQAKLETFVAGVHGTVCLTVADAGRAVYSHNGTQPVTPASIAKMMTGDVALRTLGPGYTFTTQVVAPGGASKGTVAGNLWFVGGGDPLLETTAYAQSFEDQPRLHTSIEQLADNIVASGVKSITGSIVGDESRYDTARYVSGWPQRYIDQHQTGPLSALDVDDGFTAFPPNPDVTRPADTPAPAPAAYAATVLTNLLRARGVTVAGAPLAGKAPAGSVAVAKIQSPKLSDIVGEMLRESDNTTAELLTKEVGVKTAQAGTTAAGTAAITASATKFGYPTAGLTLVDGSGLDEDDHTTCNLVQDQLDTLGPRSAIAAGLPVAGQTGTLAKRFLGSPAVGRLRAKTGTLNEVTALAGFVQTLPGSDLSFTYIVNLPADERVSEDDLALQDQLVGILLGYPEGPPLATVGPVAVTSTTG